MMKHLAIAEQAPDVGSTVDTVTVDQYVGQRIRRRRTMMGLTQQKMADLIGTTYKQVHKYENGINRVASGRLYQIAQTLGVEISYFFEGVEPDGTAREMLPQQRMLLDLARNVISLKSPHLQEAVCNMARALSHRD